MATMREVAAHARVSQKTVSRVFNDDPQVRPETRERVLEAMRELDYVLNPIATVFRSGKLPAIGIAVPEIEDPFFAAVVRGADEVARAADMSTLVTSIGDGPDRECEVVRTLLRRAPSGLIIAPVAADQGYMEAAAAALPVVFVDRPARNFEADCFRHDDSSGAAQAVRHLIERGHEHIAFVGDRGDLPTTASRLESYLDTLSAHGLNAEEAPVYFSVVDRASARSTVQQMISENPAVTAVFSSNARITMLLVPALKAYRISLVSFGDFPMADALTPPVCVVDQDPDKLGRLAAQRVLDRVSSGSGLLPTETTVLPVGLVERGSCRFNGVEDHVGT